MSRVFVVLMVLFFVSPSLMGQCTKGNCSNGEGTYIFKSGSKFVGTFKDGRIHKFGTLYFSDGRIYKGQWANQRRHGVGVMKFLDGSIYSGSFVENKKEGKGRMTMANGDIIEGKWENDKLHGRGFITYASGQKRMLTWNFGQLIGETNAESSNAVLASTTSTEPAKKPQKAENLLNCNRVNCGNNTGRYTYRDGSYYEGEFLNGLPQGDGICYYSNGDRYEGGWENNAPEGEGVMYFASGTVYGAIWNAGYPIKKITAAPERPTANRKTQLASVAASKEVKIYAVIVGIASYNHMPTLKYTDDDAYQVYAFLKSPEGGAIPDERISLLIDESASRERILSAMESTFAKADENDVIMLYYSGHGLPGSFLPIDFDGYNNVLQHAEIKEILDKSHAKHKIVLADACHSGSLLAMKTPFNATRMQSFLDGFESASAGTALFTSSKSEEISMETSGLRQGIYSHYLIRGLRGEADVNGNKIVTISELYGYVSKNVRTYTANRQTPVIAGNYDDNMPIAIVR
jgi:hypothetical protein